MIESYLRANKMFVDYNEVSMEFFLFFWGKYMDKMMHDVPLLLFKSSPWTKGFIRHTWNWTLQKLSLVFQVQRGKKDLLKSINPSTALTIYASAPFFGHLITLMPKCFRFFCRPHDRVLLKDMQADWHSCLDSKVGFKVH